MTPKDRSKIQHAIHARELVTVAYAKPGAKGKQRGGAITRYVKPYELSVNRKGHAVVWGEDTIHPGQLHAFRTDRIMAVKEAERPQTFTPKASVGASLRTFGTTLGLPPKPRPSSGRTKRGR